MTLTSSVLKYPVVLFSACIAFAQQQPPKPPPNIFVLVDQACSPCHERGSAGHGPDRSALRKMAPEALYKTLSTHKPAAGLSDREKRSIASFLGGRPLNIAQTGDAKVMPNHCPGNPPIGDLSAAPVWNGWGVDIMNTRFQPAKGAALSPDQTRKLKLKWAFGLPGATAVNSQPTLAAGRVYIAVETGYVYALDAATGCVYWSFLAEAGMRSAITIATLPGSTKHALYFGDTKANAYALDASNGELIWKVSVDDHPVARITGAPQLYQGRLYVPVASLEDPTGARPNYPCCTFRGSVVALDAGTGRQIWKTHTILPEPAPSRKTSKGVQLWTGAGAGVWSAPTIDVQRRAVYVGTGNGFTEPAPKTTDAIVAMDLDSGKTLWSVQDLGNDAFVEECTPGNENCPKTVGPDYDFGSSPMLKSLPNGRRILVAGQKSGDVWAHDPDHNGAVVWKTHLADAPPSIAGQIVWGGAVDDQNAYFGLNSGGVAALGLKDGTRKWFAPLTPPPDRTKYHGEDAALAAIPGVVFSGGWDGHLRALSAETGQILWDFDMAREFKTVNGIAAKGGSMSTAGPTIAGGMLFVGSGYISNGVENGMPGNVLLAFSPE
jgi:polyvinyl alcohol dehydrogenase (cytochrome)